MKLSDVDNQPSDTSKASVALLPGVPRKNLPGTHMPCSALFLTYDGLLDPLGGSQILPYLKSIAAHPRPLHVVSFEKPQRYAAGGDLLHAQLRLNRIKWTPLPFTSRYGKLGKAWDLLRMYATAFGLHLRVGFDVIHCRSYQAMQVGRFIRKFRPTKLIFDMRGFWVDDRLDGGRWRVERWVDRTIYNYMKRLERHMLESADSVVVLTNAAARELPVLAPRAHAVLSTIPCCADYSHFTPLPAHEALETRRSLGLSSADTVISYLGSLGGLYLIDSMLKLFGMAAFLDKNVKLFFITQDWNEHHEQLVRELGLEHLRSRIIVRSATRDEVPRLLAVSDVMLCFYRPGFSRKGTSPTKIAEAFALGVPVICNTGVGDVEQLVQALDGGLVIDLSQPDSLEVAARAIKTICSKGGQGLRDRSRSVLGLEVAEAAYRDVYEYFEDSSCISGR